MAIKKRPEATTFRVAGTRKTMAEYLAVAIAQECGRPIKVSDVLNFVLDKYLTPSIVEEFVENELRKKIERTEKKESKND